MCLSTKQSSGSAATALSTTLQVHRTTKPLVSVRSRRYSDNFHPKAGHPEMLNC